MVGLTKNYVPLWSDKKGNWAICLARQLSMNEYADIGPAVLNSKCNHSIALLERESSGNWKTRYCTAVIEFKMLQRSIILPTDSSDAKRCEEKGANKLNLLKGKGPMLQAICYVWTWVWPSLRRMGCKDKSRMRFLVIACEKEDDDAIFDAGTSQGEDKGKNYARYVSGDLIAPPTCGDVFTYTISSSSPVGVEADVEMGFEYIEAIVEGFDICHEHMVKNLEGKVPCCLPLSGSELPETIAFLDKNETEHDLKLVASPTHSTHGSFRSSQGDIWTAQMSKDNLESIHRESKDGVSFIRTETIKAGGMLPVVVKVSSTVFVSPLINPSDCYQALTLLHDKGADLGALLCCVKLRHRAQSGLIIIMENLYEQGYQVLRPKDQMNESKYELPSLWAAFTDLFERILWKAAEEGCIFSDLRVGFDETSNVLINFNDENNLQLRLIDFDSFVQAECLEEVDNDRYLAPQLSAAAYLFLQVFILGHSYEKKQGNADIKAHSLSIQAKQIFNESLDNPFPIEAVSLLCDHYRAKFDKHANTNNHTTIMKTTNETNCWREKNSAFCYECVDNSKEENRVDIETILNLMIAIGMVTNFRTNPKVEDDQTTSEKSSFNFSKLMLSLNPDSKK